MARKRAQREGKMDFESEKWKAKTLAGKKGGYEMKEVREMRETKKKKKRKAKRRETKGKY